MGCRVEGLGFRGGEHSAGENNGSNAGGREGEGEVKESGRMGEEVAGEGERKKPIPEPGEELVTCLSGRESYWGVGQRLFCRHQFYRLASYI